MADTTGLGAPAQRGDPGTFLVGRVAGVDVLVRGSWLVGAGLIGWVFVSGARLRHPGLDGAEAVLIGLAVAVAFSLSLLAHELAHALVARSFGHPVRSITLHLLGGVTAIDREPRTPGQEFAVSASGPLASLAAGAAALAAYRLHPEGVVGLALWWLGRANLVLGVFNLLPGLPLDGGRVLRAAVWRVTGDPLRGTLVAAWVGRAVAVVVLLWPLVAVALGRSAGLLDVAIALLVAWFLWTAAGASVSTARLRSGLGSLDARRLARRALTVPGDLPLAEALRRAREAGARGLVVLDAAGAPGAVASEAAVVATPEERRPWVPVASVSRRLEPGLRLPADLAGEDLVRAMQRQPAHEYVLVEPDGGVYGVLAAADVEAALAAAAGTRR